MRASPNASTPTSLPYQHTTAIFAFAFLTLMDKHTLWIGIVFYFQNLVCLCVTICDSCKGNQALGIFLVSIYNFLFIVPVSYCYLNATACL